MKVVAFTGAGISKSAGIPTFEEVSGIKEKLSVGNDAIIGMGAAVFRDVEAGTTVVGNPARVTRGNDKHKVFI